jgi:hypothetical protein
MVSRALRIGFIKECLDAQQELLQRHRRFPVAIEKRQADLATREDVWVRKGRSELACKMNRMKKESRIKYSEAPKRDSLH